MPKRSPQLRKLLERTPPCRCEHLFKLSTNKSSRPCSSAKRNWNVNETQPVKQPNNFRSGWRKDLKKPRANRWRQC